ncbi:MAG: CoA-binding protein, partial [Pseudomonadota bacterium]
ALSLDPLPSVIWMQIGVRHAGAAAQAEAAGLTVIQNRCPKIEYQRLFGELRKGGFATGIISSKL